jgi:hypothetical protein
MIGTPAVCRERRLMHATGLSITLRVYATDGREETSPGRSPTYPTLKVTAFEVLAAGCPR